MFEKEKKYWLKLKMDNGKTINLKGEVVEETHLLVRLLRDNGTSDIIPIVRIIDINEDRGEKNGI